MHIFKYRNVFVVKTKSSYGTVWLCFSGHPGCRVFLAAEVRNFLQSIDFLFLNLILSRGAESRWGFRCCKCLSKNKQWSFTLRRHKHAHKHTGTHKVELILELHPMDPVPQERLFENWLLKSIILKHHALNTTVKFPDHLLYFSYSRYELVDGRGPGAVMLLLKNKQVWALRKKTQQNSQIACWLCFLFVFFLPRQFQFQSEPKNSNQFVPSPLIPDIHMTSRQLLLILLCFEQYL